MKFLLCFALVCAVAIAKPTDEAKKSEQLSTSLNTKNETVKSNHRVERNDKISPIIPVSSELNDNNESKTDELQSADDKQRLSYDSSINQVNPSAYSSQLTSTHNTDSSYPESSDNEQYRSVGSGYNSGGSFGLLESPGLVSSSYPFMSYGLRPGSYGYAGSNGLSGSAYYGFPGSYYGFPGSYGSSELCGSNSVIPTSYSSSIPCEGGIAQQIIHKPVLTELQEVIHKPIITEVQEIVNKPIFSEVQQVIHKPLFTEHIGLGPSYHGYQKHIVNKPIYNKPTKHFVRQPISHAATIHLADEYEQYGHNGHGVCEPETDLYRNAAPGSIGYSTPTSSFSYSSLPSYNKLGPMSLGTPYGKSVTFNTGNDGPYRSIKENSQPKAAEQIMYDKFLPYTQQFNGNQQYYDNVQFQQQFPGFQQQRGRSNEDPKQIKMDVDAIAKQIEKNPEMRKQLIKIITESIYVGDQMTQSNKNKQQDTKMQSLPLI